MSADSPEPTSGTMNVGVGCVRLGSASASASSADQVRLVHRALDAGLHTFDTADVYGSGASERLLGRALRGRRERAVVSTKGGYVFRAQSAAERTARRAAVLARRAAVGFGTRVRSSTADDVPGDVPGDEASNVEAAHDHATSGTTSTVSPDAGSTRATYQQQDFRPDHLRSALEASLGRLDTDHVDVYHLHGPPPPESSLADDVLECLDGLRSQGKLRRIGIGAESIASAVGWAGYDLVDVVQMPFGLLDADTTVDVAPLVADRGAEIWVRGVLGGGLLADALRGEPLGDHPKAALAAGLSQVARDAGLELDTLAVRWVSSTRTASTMLLGMSSTAHLERNLWILGGPPLSADVLAEVDTCLSSFPVEGSTP